MKSFGEMIASGLMFVPVFLLILIIWIQSINQQYLGSLDFKGRPIPPTTRVINGGQAIYNGIITFSNVDRNLVGNLLPTGVQLAPRKTSHNADKHPVVLMFGDPGDGAGVIAGRPSLPNGIHYSEMIFAIPYVQLKGQSGWNTYIVRMYLDNNGAKTGGYLYGYKKKKAWIDWVGDNARIRNLGDEPMLDGVFEWGSIWYDGVDALWKIPNFADMVEVMTTRIVGTVAGQVVCSHFEWDLEDAKIASAKTRYSMYKPFTSRMNTWPSLSPFENVTNGAVVMRGLQWRLSSQQIICS